LSAPEKPKIGEIVLRDLTVENADADASAGRCAELGGHVIDGPREMGGMRFCVIQDPAGAVMALIA